MEMTSKTWQLADLETALEIFNSKLKELDGVNKKLAWCKKKLHKTKQQLSKKIQNLSSATDSLGAALEENKILASDISALKKQVVD